MESGRVKNIVSPSKENKDSSNHGTKSLGSSYNNEINNNNYNQQKKSEEQVQTSSSAQKQKQTNQMQYPQTTHIHQQPAFIQQTTYPMGGHMGAIQQTQPYGIMQQAQQQQQNMSVADCLNTFRQGLRVIDRPDGVRIQQLTNYAKDCHGQHSRQIVDAIYESIMNQQNKLIYIYILDSILKNVQGDYIRLFQHRILEIFENTFLQTTNMGEKKSLIKMFMTWDLFFQHNLLENISHRCQLNEYETRLMNDEDREKVGRFKKEFEPKNLPDDILRSGMFITGSDIRNMNAQSTGRNFPNSQRAYQSQIGGMINYQGGAPTNQQSNPQNIEHLQMPGQNFNPPESNQPGMVPLGGGIQGGGQQFSNIANMPLSANIDRGVDQRFQNTNQPQPATNISTQSRSAAQILEQLQALTKQKPSTSVHNDMVAATNPPGIQYNIQTNLPHQQYLGDQMAHSGYGSSNRVQNQGYPQGAASGIGGIDESRSHLQPHQQHSIQQTSMRHQQQYGQQHQATTGGSFGSAGMSGQALGGVISRGTGGHVYTKTHIDDNFQTKTYVDHTQFGFLPSILKSFQQFKTNQLLLLGQDSRLCAQGINRPPSFDDMHSLKQLNLLAINEVYEGVKFQCAICGMRFIRNQILKKHLDMHFNKNNEFRRRGNRAVSRPQFLNEKEFVQPRSQQQNLKAGGQSGNQNQKITEDMVPYNNKDTACFICKEVFDVVHDDEEECWYFMSAKKIRLNVKDQNTGQPKKSIVVVHTDCMKQIELNRELQRQLKESSTVQTGKSDAIQGGGFATAAAGYLNSNNSVQVISQDLNQNQQIYPNQKLKASNESLNGLNGNTQQVQNGTIYEKQSEKVDLEALEQQIRGIQSSKRQFLGVQ